MGGHVDGPGNVLTLGGSWVSPGLAWMVIPRSRSFFSLGSLSFQSWRMFVALCSIPSLTSAFIFTFMPESPKFLLEVLAEQGAFTFKTDSSPVFEFRDCFFYLFFPSGCP